MTDLTLLPVDLFSKDLRFRRPAATSRGTLTSRTARFFRQTDETGRETFLGEACVLPGLSLETPGESWTKMKEIVEASDDSELDSAVAGFEAFPSVRFAWESFSINRKTGKTARLWNNDFTEGQARIPINGLIWMGSFGDMWRQVLQKIEEGFQCIKIKIGSLDFQLEFDFILKVRSSFPAIHPEIRLDANGAFRPDEALRKLEQLSALDIHSVEQPIKPGQWERMAEICGNSPLPVALDEELIGIFGMKRKRELLDAIRPWGIVLKPSLLGGFAACEEWIALAEERNIRWWITSALESSVGLNAIAQWTASLIFHGEGVRIRSDRWKGNQYFQGLGTGRIYFDDFPSPLFMRKSFLGYEKKFRSNFFNSTSV